MESRTYKPPNRERKIIGIGEEVEVRLVNRCGGIVKWEMEGNGTKLEESNKSYKFQATWTPGKIKIKATLYGQDCPSNCPSTLEIEYEVIAPNGVYFDNSSTNPHCPGIYHYQYRPSCGYSADSYLKPDNVNFYNVQMTEGFVKGEPNGPYLSGVSIPNHEANTQYFDCTELVVPGKGTKIDKSDEVWMAFKCRAYINPDLFGMVSYDIPNYFWEKTNNIRVFFANTLQTHTNAGGSDNPAFTSSKEGSSNSIRLLEPDNCLIDGPNDCE
ncbi:MAG: hypothetical protein KBF75_12640 [Saprospiraceae bacterium]|nr:hypothetical protein [Saprospiraceae bacterium]